MIQDAVVRRVWEELERELAGQGYELVEVEHGREGRGRILRLFIDKDGGVTLDDCAVASQFVGALLDAGDFIEEPYSLEVSSPGFDRPVRKASDFERFAGERIRVTAHTAVEGRRRFHGVLQGYGDGLVEIECDGTLHEVHIENLKKARLDR